MHFGRTSRPNHSTGLFYALLHLKKFARFNVQARSIYNDTMFFRDAIFRKLKHNGNR